MEGDDMIIILIFLLIGFIAYSKWHMYEKSIYKQGTKDHYLKVFFNKGKYGEYLTSKVIEKNALPTHKQLFNLYVHKKDSEEMTEIDLVYIDRTGIYVVESKNYSGWIFGNDKQLKWTQTLPNKQKFSFYNPVKQNDTHIKALQQELQLDINFFQSVIVFSERCTLKSISVDRPNVTVLKRNDLARFIKNHTEKSHLLTFNDIQTIYSKLLPNSTVPDHIKQQHIETINQKYK